MRILGQPCEFYLAGEEANVTIEPHWAYGAKPPEGTKVGAPWTQPSPFPNHELADGGGPTARRPGLVLPAVTKPWALSCTALSCQSTVAWSGLVSWRSNEPPPPQIPKDARLLFQMRLLAVN